MSAPGGGLQPYVVRFYAARGGFLGERIPDGKGPVDALRRTTAAHPVPDGTLFALVKGMRRMQSVRSYMLTPMARRRWIDADTTWGRRPFPGWERARADLYAYVYRLRERASS